MVFIAIYVDDVALFYNDRDLANRLQKELHKHIKMKDLGELSSILGIRVQRDRKAGTISKPVSTPLDANQKISAEMCAATETEKQHMKEASVHGSHRKSFVCSANNKTSYAVNLLTMFVSRYSKNPGKTHWLTIKRIFRFLKGTIDKKIVYHREPDDLKGYCDADWAGDLDQRKSTTGYIFTMQKGPISWCSRRQPTVAISTTEAEFMSMTSSIQELIWLKRLLKELAPKASERIVLYCDNNSAIQFAKNNSYSNRTKHIEIKTSFIREKIDSGTMELVHLPTEKMLADILTKPVVKAKQIFFSNEIGLK